MGGGCLRMHGALHGTLVRVLALPMNLFEAYLGVILTRGGTLTMLMVFAAFLEVVLAAVDDLGRGEKLGDKALLELGEQGLVINVNVR